MKVNEGRCGRSEPWIRSVRAGRRSVWLLHFGAARGDIVLVLLCRRGRRHQARAVRRAAEQQVPSPITALVRRLPGVYTRKLDPSLTLDEQAGQGPYSTRPQDGRTRPAEGHVRRKVG